MPERPTNRTLRLPLIAAAAMAVLILAGALIWFRPYLTEKRPVISEVPAPSALFALTEFPLAPHGQACMSSVGINPTSRVAEFHLRPAKSTPAGGPPVELVLSAPGYRATLHVPGGYPGGSVALPIAAPKRATIGTACFVNRGRTTVLLDGTTEPRTVSRSTVSVDDRTTPGDIALTLTDSQPRSLLDRLDEIFGHASNLTDRLVPVWLIWLIAALVAFGVPVGMVLAFYRGLREDERTAGL
ncbi:MAG TPA: hypothetical protein VFW38_09125 [Solirubrobacteraceae bacterium]|nr:hypothetical protein [Solirubrobacteraceae bacterium]